MCRLEEERKTNGKERKKYNRIFLKMFCFKRIRIKPKKTDLNLGSDEKQFKCFLHYSWLAFRSGGRQEKNAEKNHSFNTIKRI